MAPGLCRAPGPRPRHGDSTDTGRTHGLRGNHERTMSPGRKQPAPRLPFWLSMSRREAKPANSLDDEVRGAFLFWVFVAKLVQTHVPPGGGEPGAIHSHTPDIMTPSFISQ